ncbi:MAG: carboxypeptidase-like regulatory domain-containing protein [Acidobacteriaceae bacterium]
MWIVPSCAFAADTSIGGVVRDRGGIPQIGALVELLRGDRTPVASVRTDGQGTFTLAHLLPGVYQLRATETAYLPSVRQHLRVAPHQQTLADITLSTLFEAADWIPAERRSASEPDDDWKWTLRSSANRPLLRFDEDGPVLVYEGNGEGAGKSTAEGKAPRASETRVSVRGGGRIFGESGVQNTVEYEQTAPDGRRALVRAQVGTTQGAPSEYTAAYERATVPGQPLRAAVAFLNQPGVTGSAPGAGMQIAVLRTAQAMQLLPSIQAEFGNEIVAMNMGREQIQSHPFASVKWRGQRSTLGYALATARQAQTGESIADDGTLLPRAAVADGRLALEHGLHQELRWTRELDSDSASGATPGAMLTLAVFDDSWSNSILNGGGTVSSADSAAGQLLIDPVAGVLRAAGHSYAGPGFLTSIETHVSPEIAVSATYAIGPALQTSDPADETASIAHVLASLHARTAHAVTLAASGTVVRTGTHFRASYRFQHADELTPVDPCDSPLEEAYLSMFLRQPIHRGRIFPGGMEATVDVRNLLAQGYYPFMTRDGSTLYFAQAGRSIEGGIAFTF